MTEIERAVESLDLLGETPLWCDHTQTLYWIDIDNRILRRFKPETGAREFFRFKGGYLGSLALRASGGMLLGIDGDLLTWKPGGDPEPFASLEPPERDTRLNDGRVDARGRFWVGSMDNQLHRPLGSFYRVDPDGAAPRLFDNIIVTNSVSFSPDQKTMYFSDTRRFVLWAFDIDIDDGVLTNKRVFHDHTASRDRPDGTCVDADGGVWNAIFAGGRVVRYAPDGRIDRAIDLPVTNPTCVCFGGSDLKTLFVTTARKFLSSERLEKEPLAGSVLALRPGAQGLPEHRFGG